MPDSIEPGSVAKYLNQGRPPWKIVPLAGLDRPPYVPLMAHNGGEDLPESAARVRGVLGSMTAGGEVWMQLKTFGGTYSLDETIPASVFHSFRGLVMDAIVRRRERGHYDGETFASVMAIAGMESPIEPSPVCIVRRGLLRGRVVRISGKKATTVDLVPADGTACHRATMVTYPAGESACGVGLDGNQYHVHVDDTVALRVRPGPDGYEVARTVDHLRVYPQLLDPGLPVERRLE
jgi:hypothetical protein